MRLGRHPINEAGTRLDLIKWDRRDCDTRNPAYGF